MEKKQTKKNAPVPGIETSKVKGVKQDSSITLESVRALIKSDLKRLENMIIAYQSDAVMNVLADYFYSKWVNMENEKVKHVNQVEMEFDKQTEAAI